MRAERANAGMVFSILIPAIPLLMQKNKRVLRSAKRIAPNIKCKVLIESKRPVLPEFCTAVLTVSGEGAGAVVDVVAGCVTNCWLWPGAPVEEVPDPEV